MHTPHDPNDERVDPETELPDDPQRVEAEQTETDPTQSEPTSADLEAVERDGEIEALDVQLGPGDSAPTPPVVRNAAEDEAVFDSTVDPSELPSSEIAATTLPILGGDGKIPDDIEEVARGLELWEEAAAEVPGDPHFTPLPVQKPRKAMLLMDRGPFRPLVWLDREVMTPVLYEGEPPASANRPDAFPIPDEYGDAQQQLGVSRPPLVVTLARAPQHFLAALDQRGAQIDARAGAIAQDKIDYERWSQRCQERAIHGDY